MRWLNNNTSDLVLSSIVLAELRFYVAKMDDGQRKEQANRLVTAIDAGAGSRYADFGSDDAQRYGELMAHRRRSGTPMSAVDGLIAAQALVRGHSLATRNVKDFQGLGLSLIIPWND